jgi:CO/xanthine dehydrogenase FAD-binding subunit
MKAAPFRYERPRTLEEATTMLGADESAKALAGGQSLVPMMVMRLARPTRLVDLGQIESLRQLERDDGALVTGAMVRQRVLERRAGLAAEVPLVAAALPWVGHREIRNRGTVGGSIAHADPSAELSLVAAVLRAGMVVAGRDGRTRAIPGDEFATGPFQTVLAPDELLTAIRWPVATAADGFAFEEVARRHGDFALCGVAVWARYDEQVRVGLLGVGPAPVIHEVRGRLDDGASPADVAAEIAERIEPSGDMHASAGYRRRLARVLVRRCLERALGRAPDG